MRILTAIQLLSTATLTGFLIFSLPIEKAASSGCFRFMSGFRNLFRVWSICYQNTVTAETESSLAQRETRRALSQAHISDNGRATPYN